MENKYSVLLSEFPEIDASDNLAYMKPTRQHSTYPHTNKQTTMASSLAVDGHSGTFLYRDGCARTTATRNSWWLVDLGALYKIFVVVITSQGDSKGMMEKCVGTYVHAHAHMYMRAFTCTCARSLVNVGVC